MLVQRKNSCLYVVFREMPRSIYLSDILMKHGVNVPKPVYLLGKRQKKEEFETYNEEEGQFGYLGNPKKLNFQSTASN